MPEEETVTIPGTKKKIPRKAAIIGGIAILAVVVFLIARARSGGGAADTGDGTEDGGVDESLGPGGTSGGSELTSPGEVLGWDTTQPPSEISAPGDMYIPETPADTIQSGYVPNTEAYPVPESIVAEIGDVGAGRTAYYGPSNIQAFGSGAAKERAAAVTGKSKSPVSLSRTPAKKAQPKVAAAKTKAAPTKKAQVKPPKPVKGKTSGTGKRGK